MNKLILVCILSVAILAFTQSSAICSSNADCNDWSTFDDKICEANADPLLRTCIARTSFDFKTTNSDAKGKCKDSFNFNAAGTTCGHYAMDGCDIPDADVSFFRCIDSDRDATTKKCKANAVAATWVGEGVRCDTRTDKRIFCGDNLVCIDNVCRAKLLGGDNCDPASTLTCRNGMVCDGDFCRPEKTLYDGERCKSNGVCRGNSCQDGGVCLEKRAIPCFSNAHCSGLAEVCYKTSGSIRGTCTQGVRGGEIKVAACLRENYQAVTAAKPVSTACDKQITEAVCAGVCKLRADLRVPPADSRLYTYNCQTMTRTLIAAGSCAVKEFVTGCPTVPTAGAMMNGLSVLLFAIIALIFA